MIFPILEIKVKENHSLFIYMTYKRLFFIFLQEQNNHHGKKARIQTKTEKH